MLLNHLEKILRLSRPDRFACGDGLTKLEPEQLTTLRGEADALAESAMEGLIGVGRLLECFGCAEHSLENAEGEVSIGTDSDMLLQLGAAIRTLAEVGNAARLTVTRTREASENGEAMDAIGQHADEWDAKEARNEH